MRKNSNAQINEIYNILLEEYNRKKVKTNVCAYLFITTVNNN